MYLSAFTLPLDEEEYLLDCRAAYNGGIYGYIDNPYPCGLFTQKRLYDVHFARVTIFYGGNGSGKSTLLNLIAEKLKLKRIAPYNSGEMFASYVERCGFSPACDDEGETVPLPENSRIITSDDIFDYMLAVRTNNREIAENMQAAREDHRRLKYGDSIRFSGMEDYEEFRLQVLSRRKSVTRRQFIRRTAGEELILGSNGETALEYFREYLKCDTFYCLDEPENSMSPKMQLKLRAMLEEMARCCGCQFVIATHSPFLLAMDGAMIYDLDAVPAQTKPWWALENVRAYYEFFQEHAALFEKEPE